MVLADAREPALLACAPLALVLDDSVRLLLLGGSCSLCVGLLASPELAGAAVADARSLVSRQPLPSGLLALGRLILLSFLASERSRRPHPRRRSRTDSSSTSAKGAHERSAGSRVSARTSAEGAHARSAGARTSASTSAEGTNARKEWNEEADTSLPAAGKDL